MLLGKYLWKSCLNQKLTCLLSNKNEEENHLDSDLITMQNVQGRTRTEAE